MFPAAQAGVALYEYFWPQHARATKQKESGMSMVQWVFCCQRARYHQAGPGSVVLLVDAQSTFGR